MLATLCLAGGLYLEHYELEFLGQHPIIVNLISDVIAFGSGVAIAGIMINRVVESERLQAIRTDLYGEISTVRTSLLEIMQQMSGRSLGIQKLHDVTATQRLSHFLFHGNLQGGSEYDRAQLSWGHVQMTTRIILADIIPSIEQVTSLCRAEDPAIRRSVEQLRRTATNWDAWLNESSHDIDAKVSRLEFSLLLLALCQVLESLTKDPLVRRFGLTWYKWNYGLDDQIEPGTPADKNYKWRRDPELAKMFKD